MDENIPEKNYFSPKKYQKKKKKTVSFSFLCVCRLHLRSYHAVFHSYKKHTVYLSFVSFNFISKYNFQQPCFFLSQVPAITFFSFFHLMGGFPGIYIYICEIMCVFGLHVRSCGR